MKQLYAIIFLLITVPLTYHQAYAYKSNVDSQYVFLNDLDIFILLKREPCSLTENQMIGLKTELLALGNTSKISRNKTIKTLEKLNSIYGYTVDVKNLRTCTAKSLDKPNQKIHQEDEF